MGRKRKGKSIRRRPAVIAGSMGLEETLAQNAEQLQYDEAGKKVLQHAEVLANILKYLLPEYADYSTEEIAQCIEPETIDGAEPIAPDTDTRIHGDNTEAASIKEATLTFDSRFRAKIPTNTLFHLHVDVELQKDYYPGYPIEKRGIYHLSRLISSQLEVINKRTSYGKVEKACVIFVCVGNIPKYLWNTVSYYQFANTKNIGDVSPKPENFDLMDLIIIRLGAWISEDTVDIIRFLHGIFFNEPKELKPYIDFSKNEAFRKEVERLGLTGEHLIERARLEYEENVKKYKKELQEKDRALQEMGNEIEKLKAQLAERKR